MPPIPGEEANPPPLTRGPSFVLVPHLNGVEPECEKALQQLEQSGVRVVRRAGCSAIDVARNESPPGDPRDLGVEVAQSRRTRIVRHPFSAAPFGRKRHAHARGQANRPAAARYNPSMMAISSRFKP